MKAGLGRCSYCDGVFTKAGVIKHLHGCPARAERTAASRNCFWLSVSGDDAPRYWMYLQVPVTATLDSLDTFLKRTWLDFNGHLSLFRIEGIDYMSYPLDECEPDERDMDVGLGEVFQEGMEIFYAYDFGCPTRLKLKVLGLHAAARRSGIEIMARNLAPVIKCSYCDNAAEKVCIECHEDGAWLCGGCAGKHGHGEEYLLPVVNSPRVGVGDYEGDE